MPFIQEQNAIRQDYKPQKKHSPVLRVVRSQSLKGVTFVLIFAIAVPLLIYYFVIDKGEEKKTDLHTCSVSKIYRVPCGDHENNVTKKYCDQINCCFDKTSQKCYHYLPSKYYYYQKKEIYAPSFTKTPFGEDSKRKLFLDIEEVDETRLKITLTDQNTTKSGDFSTENKSYVVKNVTNPMMVEVFRNETQDLIFTTSKGPLIFSESYWEWTFQLTDEYLFGLGQTLIQLDENSTLTKVIYRNGLDQDSLPIFLAYKKGRYHGLIVRHDGPLEVTVLPSNLVILRGLIGNTVTLELSTGPKLKDVLAQQRRERSFYKLWTLGVHLCREDTSTNLKNILNEYNSSDYNFQYESDCIHQNLLMSLRDENTKDTDIEFLNQKIIQLQNTSKHFVFCLPPQVSSSLYNDTNVFFKNEDGEDYEGLYLGNNVKFPYFAHESIADLISKQFEEIKTYIGENLPTNWFLNHNWPLDESFEMNVSESLSYLSMDLREAMSSTLPWNLVVANQTQMSIHNQYGEQHVKAIEQYLNTETVLFTASRNLDTSHPVIIQNYAISWTNFKSAISKLLSDGLFGGRFLSIPVCGSTDNFNSSMHEPLCIRWYLMAATSPFFRISSDYPRRDPGALATQMASKQAVKAIDLRYELRQYFYTVLNNEDEPLMRPMFYDFPDDNETFPLVDQYMVGGSLMVAHPTLPERTLLAIYLPPSVSVWYEFNGGEKYPLEIRDEGWVQLNIVETDWIAFIPEGKIIPLTEVIENGTTVAITLKVGLCGKNSTDCKTQGSLLFGSNLFVFTSTEESLTVEKREPSINEAEVDDRMLVLNKITIFGMGNGTSTYGISSNDLCQISQPLNIMYKIPFV